VALFSVSRREPPYLAPLQHVFLGEGEGLALSLSWDDLAQPSRFPRAAVSTQSSSLHVTAAREATFECLTVVRGAHQLFGEFVPAWAVAFDLHQPARLASGGDDCALKLWDTRLAADAPAAAVNKKSHAAGVTSVRTTLLRSSLIVACQ